MTPLYPIVLMLVPSILAVVSLHAQTGAPFPNESRSPMAIRNNFTDACKVSVGGTTWVGRTTTQGGTIAVRDLSGAGIQAVAGVIRYEFASGRYFDSPWKYQTLGVPSASAKVSPSPAQFDAGLTAPTRVQAKVLGVYFGNGSTCGETGATVKSRYEDVLVSLRKDADEVMHAAETMPADAFAKAARAGLIKEGPYTRDTTPLVNTMLKAQLFRRDGKLILEYKQWLQRWYEQIRPAKPAHQTRSSPPPGH